MSQMMFDPDHDDGVPPLASFVDRGRDRFCKAPDCPNVWTVICNGLQLCSAHSWQPRHLWDEISRVERAKAAGHAPAPETKREVRRIVLRMNQEPDGVAALRDEFAGAPPGVLHTVARLRAIKAAGTRLTIFQSDVLRDFEERYGHHHQEST